MHYWLSVTLCVLHRTSFVDCSLKIPLSRRACISLRFLFSTCFGHSFFRNVHLLLDRFSKLYWEITSCSFKYEFTVNFFKVVRCHICCVTAGYLVALFTFVSCSHSLDVPPLCTSVILSRSVDCCSNHISVEKVCLCCNSSVIIFFICCIKLLCRYFNLCKLRVNICWILLTVGRFLTCHFGLNLFIIGTSRMAVFHGHFVYRVTR